MSGLNPENEGVFKRSFKLSLQIFFAYFPIAVAFGLIYEQMNLPWHLGMAMSFFTYSPSTQFLALSMISAKAGPLGIAAASAILGLRQVFFGLSFLDRYPKKWGLRKIYLILTLSDETYSILALNKYNDPSKDKKLILNVSVFNHLYWMIGSAVGILAGKNITFETPGIDFMMTGLFTVLTIEQSMNRKDKTPFVVATGAAFISYMIHPGQMLFISILMSSIILLMIDKWKEMRESHFGIQREGRQIKEETR